MSAKKKDRAPKVVTGLDKLIILDPEVVLLRKFQSILMGLSSDSSQQLGTLQKSVFYFLLNCVVIVK